MNLSKRILIAIGCLIFFSKVVSQAQNTDGDTYKTIVIGKQTWMAENLNTSKFKNGDPITHAKTDKEWQSASENKQPAWCYNNNDPVNGRLYGMLFNWYAVADPRGLAPKGWHVPSSREWTSLMDYVIENEGPSLKSLSDWKISIVLT